MITKNFIYSFWLDKSQLTSNICFNFYNFREIERAKVIYKDSFNKQENLLNLRNNKDKNLLSKILKHILFLIIRIKLNLIQLSWF